MKIIYITSSLPYGPGEAFILPEVIELLRQGHEVLIVPMYPRGPIIHENATRLLKNTMTQPLFSLEIGKETIKEIWLSPFKTIKALGLILNSRTRKIFLKNLAIYPKSLWLAGLVRKWRADHIHAHWAATTSSIAMIASEISGVSWSFTAHRWDIVENNHLELKTRKASFVRFISKSGLEMAKKLGIREINGKVLHMGVHLHDFEEKCNKPEGSWIVLCPANFILVKGHKYLIEAFAILKDRGINIALHLAGQGELKLEISRQVEKLNLSDRVHFLGQVPHSELLTLYREGEIDIVVLPSIDLGEGLHEGIPVSLIEAMSFEIPVVSTTTGGIPELVEDNAGILIPPNDPIAIADVVERLINDSKLRRELGYIGKNRVGEKFDIKKIVTELVMSFKVEGDYF